MRKALVLSTLCWLSTTALAGPAGGRYKTSINENPGFLWLGASGDVTCGYYYGSGITTGSLTLKADGSTLDGVWDEGSSEGKATFHIAGKNLDGSYTENLTDPGTSPWTATFDGMTKVKVEKSYELDWGGGIEKTTVVFKQKGNKVDGKIAYRYSGSEGGTMTGTLTGDVLVGTWKGKDEDGTPTAGRFILVFQKTVGSKKFDSLRGMAGSGLTSCGDAGTLSGSTSR